MRLGIFALVGAFVLCAPAFAEPQFDSKPWLEDLAQAREAFTTKYANLEWAVFDREADLPALFADAQKRVEAAQSETDARAAFDRLARRLGDGHVGFRWQSHSGGKGEGAPCADYDASIVSAPMVARVKGYQPVVAARSSVFPIGMIAMGGHRIGVIRIGLFEPQGYPEICRAALTRLSIPADQPCDDACSQRIGDFANKELSDDFMAQLEALIAARPDLLLVDITRNGGGSEWAEAVARMLTSIRITSERLMFVRGEHWVKHFAEIEADLREAAKNASPDDRARLLKWAEEADAKKRIAATPCDSAPLWQRKLSGCSWLGEGFPTTGFLASADPSALRGKSWAAEAFTPMEFDYREGIWRGPLIVAVDGGTGSAAEEFAATLQDNRAALIVGEPTVGAGCGHTDGGTPTMLKNSRAILELPDCARIRADGSNEVRGIRPDVLVGWRVKDGPGRRAEDFSAALAGIIREAEIRQKPSR
jgi:hypothetical protein